MIQPNVHVVAVFAHARLDHLVHALDDALVVEEAHSQRFQVDRRTHERDPRLAVDRQRDGRLHDGLRVERGPLPEFVTFISNRLVRGEHCNSCVID